MNIKKLAGLNEKINNVFKFTLPYWRVIGAGAVKRDIYSEGKNVIFFGSDMSGFLKLGIEKKLFIKRYNECLGYVRDKYKGYSLYYKPHPSDDNEKSILDLKGFEIVKEKTTAEIFLLNNHAETKAVFSIGSFSNANAYSMGLNSHVFCKCFADIFKQKFKDMNEDFFFEMPRSFFIDNLNQDVTDNSRILRKDENLEANLREILHGSHGKIWFIVSSTEYIIALIALSKLIKDFEPDRKIGLIISRHHRWDIVSPDYYKSHFDDIAVLPRIHYSLKPARLWQAIRIARKIKNFNISPDDILISASQVEFVENCFVSYHKKNLTVGLILNRDFNMHYNPRSLTYMNNDRFRFSKASWFYNKVFEPVLGLNRSLFMFYDKGAGFYITRYQRPVNEVFSRVYVLNNAS